MAPEPSSVVVSIRLTPDERQLVEDAASKKGWKPATFLRVSALERAAHVLNLSRQTSFGFQAVAARLADALVAPRRVRLVDTEVNAPWGEFGTGVVDVPDAGRVTLGEVRLEAFSPAPLSSHELERFKDAVRLGGVEFAMQLLTECQRLLNEPTDAQLPPPIDPDNLTN